jgi:hypothetical protein
MASATYHRLVVVVADGCHLCEAALEVIERVRKEIPFALEVVDIAGDADLEARYRASIPVVEIDGDRAFTYFVTEGGLRTRLG